LEPSDFEWSIAPDALGDALGAAEVAPCCLSAPPPIDDCAMAWFKPNINAAVATPAIKYFRIGYLLLIQAIAPELRNPNAKRTATFQVFRARDRDGTPASMWRDHMELRSCQCVRSCGLRNGVTLVSLLKWALIFLVVSIVAGLLGFTGISAASADVARVLFYIFVVIFLVLLVLGLTVFRA
jgi:uncharacterized membrane protein YtjA (UPF0391 family)